MTTFLAPRNAAFGITPTLTGAGSRYFMRAAFGVCDDTLSARRQDFERLLSTFAEPNRRDQMRTIVISRAATLAFPCSGAAAFQGLPTPMPLDRALLALARGARGEARALLDTIQRDRQDSRPGDLALDHTFHHAWVRAQVGDTAAAEDQIDRVLAGLSTLGTFIAREEAQSAAVGRLMAFRAELAAARRDSAAARRWAANALELWASADAPLQPTLRRLRLLSGQ